MCVKIIRAPRVSFKKKREKHTVFFLCLGGWFWLLPWCDFIWKMEHTKVYTKAFKRHLNFSRLLHCLR